METKHLGFGRTGPARKFRHLFFGGPLTVVEVVSPTAVRLSGFPAGWRGHPVINASRLRPYTDSELFPGRPVADAPPEELQLGSEELVFEQVLQFVARGRDKNDGRTRVVLVRWRDERQDSWHAEAELRQWCIDAAGDTKRYRELYKILP